MSRHVLLVAMRVACLLAGVALTGCTTPTLDPDWGEAVARRHATANIQHPVAAQLLSGFDPSDASGLAQGDRVLFHITLHQGEERTGEWFLRLTANKLTTPDDADQPVGDVVLWAENPDGSHSPLLGFADLSRDERQEIAESQADPNDASIAAVQVEVFDPDGKLVGSRLEHVVRRYLETGFVTACEASAGLNVPVTEGVEREQSAAHVALVAFLQVIQENQQLQHIFWQILRLPSLWSIITNFGVSIRVAPEFRDATASSASVDHRPAKAWNMPVQVLGNESPVLLTSLQVVAPRSPRALCAGVVSMVVVRPGDPDAYLTMQLLAARRGQ